MAASPKKVDFVAKLIVEALKALKDANGSSFQAIRSHILENLCQTPSVITRLPFALKKGILFGAIKKSRGLYKLDTLMTMAARSHGRRRRRSSRRRRRRRRRRV